MDAVRLLPVLGLALWMVPLLWPVADPLPPVQDGAATPVSMSAALTYIFGVWAGLIVLCLLLWSRARRIPPDTAPSGQG